MGADAGIREVSGGSEEAAGIDDGPFVRSDSGFGS